jgi:hypothetical protein
MRQAPSRLVPALVASIVLLAVLTSAAADMTAASTSTFNRHWIPGRSAIPMGVPAIVRSIATTAPDARNGARNTDGVWYPRPVPA